MLEQVPRERHDVLAPIAQRRHGEMEHVEPVEQVEPEPARGHLRREVAIRRRHDAHVGAQVARPADAAEGHRLQYAQQLRLHGRGQLADLVEEQRPAVGDLEQPALGRLRVGEGAALVAEQLALEERLGERRAVQLDEGLLAAAGGLGVQEPRDDLLARAALALQQDRRGGAARDRPQPVERLAHGRAAGLEERARRTGAQRRHALAQPARLERLADLDEQVGKLDGLGEVVLRALPQRQDGVLDVGEIGRDQEERVEPALLRVAREAREHLDAVEVGKVAVQHHHVRGLGGEEPHALRAGLGRTDAIALAREGLAGDDPEGLLVVDEEDRAHWTSTTAKRAPRSRPCWSSMRPPCAATNRWAVARPRPVPLRLVVANGSKRWARISGDTPGPLSSTARTTPCSARSVLTTTSRAAASLPSSNATASMALRTRFTATPCR